MEVVDEDDSTASIINVGKLPNELLKYEQWHKRFVASISLLPSGHGGGVKLNYLIKDRKPAGWTPANASSPEEARLHQIPTSGAKFDKDKKLKSEKGEQNGSAFGRQPGEKKKG